MDQNKSWKVFNMKGLMLVLLMLYFRKDCLLYCFLYVTNNSKTACINQCHPFTVNYIEDPRDKWPIILHSLFLVEMNLDYFICPYSIHLTKVKNTSWYPEPILIYPQDRVGWEAATEVSGLIKNLNTGETWHPQSGPYC
jgi:hypothetical protein